MSDVAAIERTSMGKAIIETVMLDDPSMSDAELIHRRARKPNDPNVGKAPVDRNLVTLIGGLARMNYLSHHAKAAEWFKVAYAMVFGGQGGAADLSQTPVDRSILAHDSGMAARIDRAWKLRDLLWGPPIPQDDGSTIRQGGPLTSDQVHALVAVVVLERSIRMASAGGSRSRERMSRDLFAGLDTIAVELGFVSRGVGLTKRGQ